MKTLTVMPISIHFVSINISILFVAMNIDQSYRVQVPLFHVHRGEGKPHDAFPDHCAVLDKGVADDQGEEEIEHVPAAFQRLKRCDGDRG